MKRLLCATLIAAILIFFLPLFEVPRSQCSAGEYTGEKLAEFTTDYSSSSDARKHNIALASAKLNGYEIAAGETFSFNAAVGVRSVARGFREAPVIEYGKYVNGVGGGVCQVSSTLYNAVIRAGLYVTAVSHHSLPVHYLPVSLDAMVSETSDFRFINDTPYPIRIFSAADGKLLKFELFGFPVLTDGESVKIRSITVKELTCSEYERISDRGELKEGESERYISHPRSGLISEAYRDYYYMGKLMRSERLRRDYYAPRKGVIIVRGEVGEGKVLP